MKSGNGECAGKVALISGASRGIGAAIAERLAAEGAAVALCARSLDTHPRDLPGTLIEVIEKIESRGGRAVAIRADAADAGDRTRMVAECERQLGPIDVMIPNAAYGPFRAFLDVRERDFFHVYELNVRSAFHLCQLVLPGMRERRRGWIVNISSATAEHPDGPPYIPWHRQGGHHLYGASKAALNRFTTGLAAEFYDDNIAINALSPLMAVLTPGMARVDLTAYVDDSMIEPIEAIAEAAVALCTCDPKKLTGRVTYSLPLLEELGRPIRTLDGSAEYRKQ